MYRRLFVYYPRGLSSGGPRALYQLVDSIRRQGGDAFLVPMPGTESIDRATLYEDYDAPEADGLEPQSGDLVVVPEVALHLIPQHPASDVAIWWLSIDNSPIFRTNKSLRQPRSREAKAPSSPRQAALAAIRARKGVWDLRSVKLKSVNLHLAQSDYARRFLLEKEGVDAIMLSDYIDPMPRSWEHWHNDRNLITYNAAKGADLVRDVARELPGIEFRAIERMSSGQVAEAMRRSVVYLDLGHHPGKDRMPREAAVSGAIVMVSRRGSGASMVDVPIDERFKIRDQPWEPKQASSMLSAVLADRGGAFNSQGAFRARVSGERRLFDDEVRRALLL